jgi:hypothetical protein
MMKLKNIAMFVTATCAILTVGHVQAKQHGVSSSPIAGTMHGQVIGELKAVDVAARRVTVVDTLGHATSLTLGPDAQDLDKLELGTRVNGTAMKSVTLTPVRNTPPQVMLPGDKRFVARVDSVDHQTGKIVLKDGDNLPIEVFAQDPSRTAKLAGGSMVRVDVKDDETKGAAKRVAKRK